jgi:hypothetical protein
MGARVPGDDRAPTMNGGPLECNEGERMSLAPLDTDTIAGDKKTRVKYGHWGDADNCIDGREADSSQCVA